MNNVQPICCSVEATYVDNVPGKEYWYCRECKNEVLQPVMVEGKAKIKEDNPFLEYVKLLKAKGGWGNNTPPPPPPGPPVSTGPTFAVYPNPRPPAKIYCTIYSCVRAGYCKCGANHPSVVTPPPVDITGNPCPVRTGWVKLHDMESLIEQGLINCEKNFKDEYYDADLVSSLCD